MATIDLSLDALKIPALDNFNPDFGTMITETQANKGGLSTFEVNSNMMLPWAYMRPKVVVEDSVTTVVQYDAKLTFSASLQAGVTLTMDAGDYEGCEVSLRNLSAYACTVGHGTFSLEIPAGGFVRILWNGTTWEADVSSTVGSGIILPPTAAAVHAAIGDAIECGTTSTVKASMKNLITGNSGPQQNCYLIKFPDKKALAIMDLESYEVPTQTLSHYQVNITGGTIIRHITVEGWQVSNTSAGVTYCDSISDFWINNLSTANGKARCRCMVVLQLP